MAATTAAGRHREHEKQPEASGGINMGDGERHGGEGQNSGYCPAYLITVIFLEPSALPFTMI